MRLLTDRLGPNTSLGSEMIFDHLKASGESQADVARRLGTDGSYVTVWMRGDQKPSLEFALKLFAVLKIPVDAWMKPASAKFQAKITAEVRAARAA